MSFFTLFKYIFHIFGRLFYLPHSLVGIHWLVPLQLAFSDETLGINLNFCSCFVVYTVAPSSFIPDVPDAWINTLLGHDLFITWIKKASSWKEIIFLCVLGLNSNKIIHFM